MCVVHRRDGEDRMIGCKDEGQDAYAMVVWKRRWS